MTRAAIVLALVCAAPMLAQPNRGLQDALARTDTDLRAGRFAEANRELDKLSRAISEHFGSGSQAMYTVAVIASFRAVAAAGSRNASDAEWYWSLATSLFPKFKGSDLHVYGAAGEALMRIDGSQSCAAPELPSAGDVKPPQPLGHPMPKYPYHALETGIAEPIVVQVVVTEKGTTRCPGVIETHEDPSLAWVLLEAMKAWRYEPARVNGIAVPSTVQQTVDFRIDYR